MALESRDKKDGSKPVVVPVYIITLPNSPARVAAIVEDLSRHDSFIEINKIEGVKGGLLPDIVCRMLTRNEWSVNHKGVLGCFLSHARVWQMVATRSEPFSLVLEDDAILQNVESLDSLVCPEAWDIAFCNARTAYPQSAGHDQSFRSVNPVPQYATGHGQAIGTDGYLVTPQGARKLLSYVERDSFFTHVDLRMMSYALTDGWDSDFPAEGKMTDTLRGLRKPYPAEHRLLAYSLFPPITSHANILSRRQLEDDLNATLKV